MMTAPRQQRRPLLTLVLDRGFCYWRSVMISSIAQIDRAAGRWIEVAAMSDLSRGDPDYVTALEDCGVPVADWPLLLIIYR